MAVANMVESLLRRGSGGGRGERGVEDHHGTPVADRGGVCAAVDGDAGSRARRVDRPPVRPVRRRGRARLDGRAGRHRRRGSRGVGPIRVGTRRVPRTDLAGVPGRGRRHPRPGGVAAGALVGRVRPAAGVGTVDRHAAHRRRRGLRPGRRQRPLVVGAQGIDVGGRAPPAPDGCTARNWPPRTAASCAPSCPSGSSTTSTAWW
jgi:hypothetical protein